MELVYLWIDYYNNIKNTEFNFSTEFIVKLEIKEDKGTLSVNKSNDPIPKIFNNSFLNVSVIIGKNGSGKSSLLAFIKRIFNNDQLQSENYIVVIKDEEGLLLVLDKFSNRKRNLDLIPSKYWYGKIDYEERLSSKITLIFQSNSFSIYEDKRFEGNIIDISLDRLIHLKSIESNQVLIKRFEKYDSYLRDHPESESDINLRKEWDIDSVILPENLIYKSEINNQIKFAYKYKSEDWEFIPKYIEISFNSSFFSNNVDQFKKIGLDNKIVEFQRIIFDEPCSSRSKYYAKEQFKTSLYIFLILYILKNNNLDHTGEDKIDKLYNSLNSKLDFNSIIKIIHNILISTEVKSEFSGLKKVKDIVNIIDNDTVIQYHFSNSNFNRYSIEVTEVLSKLLDNIFNFWYDSDFVFNFYWGNLSAGQSALLSLFSRFPKLYGLHENDCIWLLIDEGELYLHPEWQRKYFSDLHKYLPQFYPENKIQLFLTSHSPYVVSDFPTQNIILLNKDENGYCIIVPHDKYTQTLGANISSLLSTSFFLDYQIGDFAKDYIFKLLEEIENSEKSDDNYKTLSNKIEIIGEPLIKEKLFKSLYQKYLPDDLEKRKQFLRDELEKLG